MWRAGPVLRQGRYAGSACDTEVLSQVHAELRNNVFRRIDEFGIPAGNPRCVDVGLSVIEEEKRVTWKAGGPP